MPRFALAPPFTVEKLMLNINGTPLSTTRLLLYNDRCFFLKSHVLRGEGQYLIS